MSYLQLKYFEKRYSGANSTDRLHFFRAAFIVDKQLSLYFGRPPALYPHGADVRNTIRIPYPPEWESLLDVYVSKGSSADNFEDGLATVASFTHQVELAKIFHTMIVDSECSPTSLVSPEYSGLSRARLFPRKKVDLKSTMKTNAESECQSSKIDIGKLISQSLLQRHRRFTLLSPSGSPCCHKNCIGTNGQLIRCLHTCFIFTCFSTLE